ncbi:Chromosomal replication initiator protein DnaA [bioreactor metagenome]|uniref:Chromosomal replication initiator protein DnaA n=1 Tax=bioreactor metagenome TaxID=1076179 RepID=A0A645BT46_9ZZZZ
MNDLSTIWQVTLKKLEPRLQKFIFDTFFTRLFPVSLVDDTLILNSSDPVLQKFIQENYSKTIRDTIREATGLSLQVEIIAPMSGGEDEPDLFEVTENTDLSPLDMPYNAMNPKYTFERFVKGKSNEFAHAASLRVAEAPGTTYNPFFIYGGVGLGKTHLMHAIGNHIYKNNPMARIVYIPFEHFLNEFISAIRNDTTREFRERYRNVDLLLIDDIQFISKKEETQTEFFHTFNALYNAKKQIVIACDRPPKEIPALEERIRTRFEWGMITDIQPPDLETRVAILQAKAKEEFMNVSDDVLYFIATNIKSNIRELEGALLRVNARSLLMRQTVNIDFVNDTLKDTLSSQKIKVITIDLIQEVVAHQYSITISDLKAKTRAQNIAFPRQVAMYLSRSMTDTSLKKIGEAFGGRDHATVLHAIEKIDEMRSSDTKLDRFIKEMIQQIQL